MLLLRRAHLHAPDDLGVRDLLVVDGRVVATGEDLDVGGLAVEVVDLDGATVVPGLVDGHVHVTGGGGESGPSSSVTPLEVEDLLDAGVTSVVGLLGTDDEVRTSAQLLQRVRALRDRGMSAWALVGGYHLPPTTVTGSVRSDLVHLEPVVGVGEVAISDHRSSQPTPHELLRLGADVHVGAMLAGRVGTVHLHVGDGERGLDLIRILLGSELPARLWHPTHVNRRAALLDEAFDLLDRGVTIDVTAFPDDETGVSAADAVARWLDQGASGRLTVSSDAGGSLPVFDEEGRWVRQDVGRPTGLLDAIRDVRGRGHALADVLTPFTSHPADQFGLPGRGRLTVGSSADLLVLDDDLRLLRVLARGAWHDHRTERP